jgi:hypothetical protein
MGGGLKTEEMQFFVRQNLGVAALSLVAGTVPQLLLVDEARVWHIL